MLCGYCHSSFSPKYKTQHFCSLDCANSHAALSRPSRLSACEFCKKEFTKDYKTHRFCSIQCFLKTQPKNHPRKIGLPSLTNARFAELLGMLAGDGHFGPHYIVLTLNAKADGTYALFARNLIEEPFPGSSPTIHFHKDSNVHIVQLSSVIAVKFLKSIWPERHAIPLHIVNNGNLHIPFIRGLMDTEGSFGFKIFKGKNGTYLYRQLTFTNLNKPYLEIVYSVLKKFGFKPSSLSGNKNIYISNKKDIDRYFNIFETNNPKMREAHSVENYESYLVYKAEKFKIAWLFDAFGKIWRSARAVE